MSDAMDQFITFIGTARPDCEQIVNQVQEWIQQENIPALTAFFARNNNCIPKAIIPHGEYWKPYANHDELLKSLQKMYDQPNAIRNLRNHTVRQEGTLSPPDEIFILLYSLIPFNFHPRMQESLRNQYGKEEEEWFRIQRERPCW